MKVCHVSIKTITLSISQDYLSQEYGLHIRLKNICYYRINSLNSNDNEVENAEFFSFFPSLRTNTHM